MPAKDFYKILGVDENFTASELKKQYRELAKKYHPDANQGSKKAEENFKIISTAYETLRDEKKRREYDQKRAHRARKRTRNRAPGRRARQSETRTGFGYGFADAQSDRPEDPFWETDDFAPDPYMPVRGFDLHLITDVSFLTVVLGGTIKFPYEKYINCGNCAGMDTHGREACPVCEGKRQIVVQIELDVNIPPGVADQYTLRLEHQGGEGRNGGPPGDLFLKINTLPHPCFKRIKNDIIGEVKIPPALARAGGSIEIQTPGSTQIIQLESDTLTGEEKRIPGHGAGIQWSTKKRGDFIVRFLVMED